MRPLSARNHRINRLGRLARRSGERAEERAFVVEGPSLIVAALDAEMTVEELYIAESMVEDGGIAALVDRVEREGGEVWSVADAILERVGDAVTGRGAVAVVATRDAVLPVVTDPHDDALVIVLADIGDPGNAGTLIRAGVASGAVAVVAGGGVDPTNPKVIRSTAGTAFTIPITRVAGPSEAIEAVRSAGYRTIGTVVRGAPAHDRTDLRGPVAIVLGNEARGLEQDLASELDDLVTIPMAGPAESLNVAMAGTLVAFEVLRQRRTDADPAQSERGSSEARRAGS